jgi:NodT family efflux transporter outer membrane factor (OMF) lipoprotein
MRRPGVVLALLLIVGCVSPPKQRNPEVVPAPEAWTGAEVPTAEPEDEWWTTFDDPQLDRLIGIAEEQNRDLQAAVARVDRAAAEARIAGADLKPSVGVALGGARQKQNFIGLPIPGAEDDVLSTTFTQLGLSLDVSWEVDLWGRVRAGARAALADFKATEADLRGARLSIAGQTAKLWFSLADLQQQALLASDSATSFRAVADQVRLRYEQGLRPPLDLRLALSNLAAAEALLAIRLEQLDRTTRQLEVLLGRYPSGRLLDEFPIDAFPHLPGPPPAGLPAEVVSRRPDLIAAERRLAASDQRVLQARRSLYPRLSLTASGGTASAELGDLLSGDFSVWSLVANLTQPIFQGGRLRAGVDLAEAVGDEALARYAGSVLRAYSEVESALAAEQRIAEQETHLAEEARQLIKAQELAEDRYRSGVGGYLAVLESQTRAVVAQSNLLTTQRARLTNRVDLHLALGGGFEAPPVDTARAQVEHTSSVEE